MKSSTLWYHKKFAWHLRAMKSVPTKPGGSFIDGHLYIGTASKHRAKPARLSNLLIRMKLNRS